MKLLHAESKERKQIFSKIFHTRMFWNLQEKLKEQAKGLSVQLEKNIRDCKREMEQVQEDSEKEEVWRGLLEMELPPGEEVLDCVEFFLQTGTEKEKVREADNERLQKKVEELQALIKSIEETNRLFALQEKTKEQLEILEGQKEKAGELKRQIRDGIRAQKVAAVQERMERVKTELRQFMEESAALETQWRQNAKDVQSAQIEYRKKEEEKQQREPKLQEQIVRLQEVLPRLELQKKLRGQYKKAEAEMQKCLRNCQKSVQIYETLYQQYFDAQAGILAQSLKEDTPLESKSEIDERINLMKAEIKNTKRKLAKLFDSWENNSITDDEFVERKLIHNAHIEKIKIEIDKLTYMVPEKEEYQEKIILLSEALNVITDDSVDAEIKNEYLKRIIYRIEFSRENIYEFILDIDLRDLH